LLLLINALPYYFNLAPVYVIYCLRYIIYFYEAAGGLGRKQNRCHDCEGVNYKK